MALEKRSSPTQSPSPPSTQDLKQRVITCLNKLADRDTLKLATIELESIAKTLTQDSFSSFLSCLQNTDSSCKSQVRKQCVNLLTLLSESHGNSLSPHLPKMIATLVRRLRDPDSSVRSACIVATTAMSSHITKPSFSVVSRPLIELILVEQDVNSQVGGAMCLSAAIEAASNPEVEQLRKLLPRLGKVVKSEGSKAKAAVLGVIGSVVEVGGARNKGVLDWLVPFVREFLSCDDWASRKAAAEVLGKVAFVEKDLASEYKNAYWAALESRRFDKIKIVRETMNRTLELWKEVPGDCDDVSAPSQSKSSSADNGSGGCFPSITKSFQDVGFKTPPPKKMIPTGSSPSSDSSYGTTAKNEVTLRSSNRKTSTSMLHKSNDKKPSDWKVEIAVPHSTSKVICADDVKMRDSDHPELGEKENNVNSRPETKRALFSKIQNDKVYKFGGFRSGSRVVPCPDDGNSDFVASNGTEEVYDDPKDAEDLSLIREQLLQIENQQSSLLDLLQRFIGSSQSGMNSLETRVHGLEMALDEISYDLALSSGRIPNKEYAENTCCKLPGAEFLSSKFWRRTEGRFSTSRLSSSGNMECFRAIHNAADTETYNIDNQKLQHPHGGGYILNSLSDVHDLRENSGFHSNRTVKNIIQESERSQVCSVGGLDGTSPSSVSKTQVNINRRLST
ncbi:TORTIFOLIA1-like protein 4 [Pistacia vera]|uniref:TORTIFOLIA1-like protein 4 n=1 Tax=Pistacia vera TaxID=55513 RepID=UPI001263D225|nr:TORTIFOLIA1-like protein 4 [Pistacia vera]